MQASHSLAATDWTTIEVTVACTLAAIAAALLIYWFNRRDNRKSLSYRVEATEVTRTRAGFSDLKVTYRDTPIDAPSIVNITIRNTGNAPIRAADFESNMFIAFNGDIAGEKLIVQHVASTTPHGISVVSKWTLRHGVPGIEIEPLLLNPGDSFTIVGLVNQYAGDLKILGRIAGVSEVKELASEPNSFTSKALLITSILLPLLVCLFSYFAIRIWNMPGWAALVNLAIFPVALIFFIYLIIQKWR